MFALLCYKYWWCSCYTAKTKQPYLFSTQIFCNLIYTNIVMKSSWIMCIKGLVYRLSHDCYFDINRDVSTAHCRSPSGDSVHLLSQTICTSGIVSDLCITNLAHGWWVLIQSIVDQVLSEKETDPAAVCCGSNRLLCLIVGIHASGVSIPLSLLIVLCTTKGSY